jgi:hypothetical protein
MTTSHHIQTPAGTDVPASTARSLLRDLAVAAAMLAVVFGLALLVSWLVPLELVVPRPR